MNLVVNILWGYHVLILIILVGIKLTFSSRFLQIRDFCKWIKLPFVKDKNNKNGISSFEALSTALAGSIGTGNLVGVGLAISVGGAGAIFWMWISAFFGMMTVFAEICLASYFKNDKVCGAFAYIEKIGKRKTLAYIYGLGCVLSSLAMGNMAQANSVSSAMESFGVSPVVTGLILMTVIFVLSQNGIKSVSKITSILVPFMTLFFFALSICILLIYRKNIPSAISEIISSAFTLKGGLGGSMYIAMKVGISRGVFTNEAGLGISSMAFSNVQNKSPKELGYFGIFQVFLDTIVMCSITGLSILVATSERDVNYLVRYAFQNGLGNFGLISINICMALFAFATMTATSYYGKIGLAYISKNKMTNLFPYVFAIASFVGSIMPLGIVFDISDAFNGLMAIPNLIALLYFLCKIIKIMK